MLVVAAPAWIPRLVTVTVACAFSPTTHGEPPDPRTGVASTRERSGTDASLAADSPLSAYALTVRSAVSSDSVSVIKTWARRSGAEAPGARSASYVQSNSPQDQPVPDQSICAASLPPLTVSPTSGWLATLETETTKTPASS